MCTVLGKQYHTFDLDGALLDELRSEFLFLLLVPAAALEELSLLLDIFSIAGPEAAAPELEGTEGAAPEAPGPEGAAPEAPGPFLFLQVALLWPTPLQVLHLITVPTLHILVLFGFSVESLFLSFFGLPGILTYGGATGLGLSEMGQLCIPSNG